MPFQGDVSMGRPVTQGDATGGCRRQIACPGLLPDAASRSVARHNGWSSGVRTDRRDAFFNAKSPRAHGTLWGSRAPRDLLRKLGEYRTVEPHPTDDRPQPDLEVALVIGHLLLAQPESVGDFLVPQPADEDRFDRHQLD